jgi:molybdopterin/thiamine biosynthesis adenylyltransferase
VRITLCGAGTLGGALAEHLLREGWAALRIIDHDRVESANLRNQVYMKHQVGQPKVRALEEIAMRIGSGTVEGIDKRLADNNATRLLAGSDLVADVFDNHASRRAVQEAARRLRVPCLHAGLHPSGYAEVVWDERYTVPPDGRDDACARRSARTLSLLVAAACARSIETFRDRGRRDAWSITLADLRIQPL